MRILNRNRARPGVSWWVVLGWLALLCGVSPARGQVEPWRFVVFGDSRGSDPSIPVNTNLLAELALEVVAQRPAFLLFLGDYSYSGGEEALAVWTNTMAPVFEAGIPIYPVVGNHDVYSAHLIANLFGAALPSNGPAGDAGCTYTVAHSNALLVVLNQFVLTNQYRVNQAWLNAVLATNPLPHVFVAGHLPAFKVAHLQGLHSYPAERDLFWNSLSNANARIYFCSHDHFYDHTRIEDGDGAVGNDMHQMIVGTGGAPLYGEGAYDGNNGGWTPIRVWHEAQYGYVTVEVSGDNATATWHHRVGTNSYARTSEVFSYLATPLPLLRRQYSDGRLTLSWSGPAVLQATADIAGSFTNVPGAVSPFVITNLNGPRLFYRLVQP